MTVHARFAVSPGWKALLHDAGLDVERIIRRAGLPGDLFAREKATLSTAEYFRLWTSIEAEADDPALPLHIGSMISVEAFDPPIFAALCSPNLNTALTRIAHYKKLIAPMKLHVEMGDSYTRLSLEWLDKSEAPPAALVLTELVFFVQLARIGTRDYIRPLEVRAPDLPTPRKEFTQYLGVPMKRGDAPEIRFPAADARKPFLTANPGMWQFFESDLNKRLSQLDASATTEERVRAALLELLPSGNVSVDEVARMLGTGPRTLQRRLKAEGQSFRAILDRTRESLAKHYLKNSAMSGAEISFLLGFEDPNSFFRAFNGWTGITPEQARRRMTRLH